MMAADDTTLEEAEQKAMARIDAALRKIAEFREGRREAQTWGGVADLNGLGERLAEIADELFADGVCLNCGEPVSRLMRDGDRLVRQNLRCCCRGSRRQ